jgi:hypothetical protein
MLIIKEVQVQSPEFCPIKRVMSSRLTVIIKKKVEQHARQKCQIAGISSRSSYFLY